MLDIDDVSPGDELPADTPVRCCGVVMDAARSLWTCASSNLSCNGRIETRNGLIFGIC
ncbi:hypothetical protein ACFWG6_30985 [Streptomyces erythrochromogenes]|uniref:hypothetical protein n=1 Tax=Streptomyces erythrochromogenes TaxID=285574 RepID=UPI003639FFE6